MKLLELRNWPFKITEEIIRSADEFPQARDTMRDESLAVSACILVVRGTVDTLAEAIPQMSLQAHVADSAVSRLVGQAEMRWTPSGPIGARNNDFVKLLSGATAGQFYLTGARSTVNCWEAVLLAAILSDHLRVTDRLLQIYSGGADKFDLELRHLLTQGKRPNYDSSLLIGRPLKGDVVAFGAPGERDSLAHIALATGKLTRGPQPDVYASYAGAQVVNFWPAPAAEGKWGPGTPTKVIITSIEGILAYVEKIMLEKMQATFGSPNWVALSS
jgi:hypothetical protein